MIKRCASQQRSGSIASSILQTPSRKPPIRFAFPFGSREFVTEPKHTVHAATCTAVFHITASMDILQVAAPSLLSQKWSPHNAVCPSSLECPCGVLLLTARSLLARWTPPLQRLAQNCYRQKKKRKEEKERIIPVSRGGPHTRSCSDHPPGISRPFPSLDRHAWSESFQC